ncbi:MAG: isoprenylcysteine carboxylmethyltransferase family protein [Legionellaceae bacterium]|nr:isoprenylcysteine carboxylmethyltransferase family protein [Legionellaceae bacterium]
MHTALSDTPMLIESRQLHSRIIVSIWLLLMLVTEPRGTGQLLHFGMLWLGYILIVIGVLGRIYCANYIGGYKNKTIVSEGPFSVVRNPLYVFSLIASIGISLQTGMLIMPLIFFCIFCGYYTKVVAKEEAVLTHIFGEDYTKYVQKVPRWIPKLQLWHEPCTLESKPLFIRRTLTDAAVFFLLAPFFEIIRLLHEHLLLPIYLSLP